MAIDITTPPGAPPHDLLHQALSELCDRIVDRAAASERPPQLGPASQLARAAQERDDVEDLQRRLLDVAHGAIASLVRVRACAEPPTEGS